jgi:DNA-binding MarR family transcriptional regulator
MNSFKQSVPETPSRHGSSAKSVDDEKRVLASFLKALKPFRALRQTMPLQYVTAFLLVASDENQNVSEYAKRAGTSQSLMTRHLADLGTVNRYHEEGFGLVEGYDDAMDRRNRLIRLTAKGQRLVGQIFGSLTT